MCLSVLWVVMSFVWFMRFMRFMLFMGFVRFMRFVRFVCFVPFMQSVTSIFVASDFSFTSTGTFVYSIIAIAAELDAVVLEEFRSHFSFVLNPCWLLFLYTFSFSFGKTFLASLMTLSSRLFNFVIVCVYSVYLPLF